MTTTKMGVACAYVAVDRNLVKVYDGKKVYMKDCQEFGFWLVNNTRSNQVAYIEINGKPISTQGIVLRPGQNTWLDCNWDTHRRFKFETYEIDGSKESLDATSDNGRVVVKFYAEKQVMSQPIVMPPIPLVNPYPPYPWSQPTIMYFSQPNIIYGMPTTCNVNYSSTPSSSVTLDCASFDDTQETKSFETGRIEAGSKSDQKFESVDMQFDNYSSYYVEYIILPESQLPVRPGNFVMKCECGKKIKHKDKFCSRCGKKLK